ncbi:hypothetical protein ARMSODRAFT_955074 [Armillaria solidipes]|uniref:F-box domain-containing protein n=1 Tax=Armillaria solidipes TaxID=1076256 RepID=A0A2H3BNQ1_9AGAR|nr:hypothetical protein ARMSODRAFT_955074 [Armillaria solidipes]
MDPRSALSDVPPEVFCKIFALASGGQSLKTTQGLWAISGVCSHWRSVALSDPTLWARLQINLMVQVEIVKKAGNRRKGLGNSFDDFLNHLASLDSDREEVEEVDEIVTYSTLVGAGEDNEDLQEGDIDPSLRMRRETTCLSEGAIAALREHLTRSQSVPLYVNVSVPSTAPPTTPYLIPFIELLLSQSHRFKRLSTDIPVTLITPDYKNLGCVRHLKTHIPPSFAFETLSLPAVTACHFLIEGTSTPPLGASKPREKPLESLRELVLESQNPIHAQDLQVPISALQLPTTLASLTIRNLALSVAVVRHLPETQEMYIVKEPKAYMAYLPEDIVVALINTIERRLDHDLLRSVSIHGFTVPKLDRSLWHRIEVLNARDNVAVKFISLWR